jgi:hypothetical protein
LMLVLRPRLGLVCVAQGRNRLKIRMIPPTKVNCWERFIRSPFLKYCFLPSLYYK